MKAFLLFSALFLLLHPVVTGQDTTTNRYVTVYTIEKNTIKGELLSDDGREVTILSPDLGKVIIPKFQIRKMEFEKAPKSADSQYYTPEKKVVMEDFKYYTAFSTNGLPFNDDKITMRIPLFSSFIVDVPLRKNINITFGSALFWGYFGTAHFRLSSDEDGGFAIATSIGSLATFGSRRSAGDVSGFAARACYTIGDRAKNLTFGGGYGSLFNFDDYASYFFVSAMKGILNDRAYFMMESHTVPMYSLNLTNFSFRVTTKKHHAFDFGLTALIYERTVYNYPNPNYEDFMVVLLPHLGLSVKL